MKIVKLNTPVRIRNLGFSLSVDEISLKQPVVKDLFGLEFTGDKGMQSQVILASRLSGYTAINKMLNNE